MGAPGPTSSPALPEARYRHNTLLVMFGCVVVTSVVSLGLSGLWSFDGWEQWSLAALTVKNIVLFVWLWRRPGHFGIIGRVELLFEGGGGVVKLAHTLLVEHTAYGLGGYTFWLILYYFVASLVFRGRAAVLASLALYVPLLVLGVLYWWSPAVPPDLKALHGNTLMQMYLLHGAFIAFLALQARLLRVYLAALLHAERDARYANEDALTGLPNRRQLEAWLHLASRESAASGEPLSVILFDLDHFKRINDTHGHDAGDRVLQGTAAAARTPLEPGDHVGRWGGEEFLVILPGSDGSRAGRLAEALQGEVAALDHGEVGRVTVSCGVAQAARGEGVEETLRRADEALYAAKRGGRALVRVAG